MANDETALRPDDIDAHDAWRTTLLTSLRDCGVQRAPRLAFLRYPLAMLGYGFTFSVTYGLSAVIAQIARTASPVAVFLLYALLFIFFVTVLARIRNYFLRSAWQSSARTAEEELKQLGSRRPIFYLRSFGLDNRIGRRSWLEMFFGFRPMVDAEQRLTAVLKKLGPVIAIGRPSEKLPKLGAARFYAADDRWQDKVIDVVGASQLVVWATGVTEGLKWEISYLTKNLKPQRLLLWCHPHLLGVSVARREAEWKQFRETLGGIFPKPLPETLGDTRFIIFDADWTPIPVTPQIDHVFSVRQDSALKHALHLRQNVVGVDPVPAALAPQRNTLTFGSLLGARGATPDWPLVGAFFLALAIAGVIVGAMSGLLAQLQGAEAFVTGGSVFSELLSAAVLTAAAVTAFRFLRGYWLPALATAAVMMLFELVRGAVFHGFANATAVSVMLGDFVLPFMTYFLFIVALGVVRAKGAAPIGGFLDRGLLELSNDGIPRTVHLELRQPGG